MHDWNVIISIREEGYAAARDLLRQFAEVGRTHYFDVAGFPGRTVGLAEESKAASR